MDISNAIYFEPMLSGGELALLIGFVIASGIFFAWLEQKAKEEHTRW